MTAVGVGLKVCGVCRADDLRACRDAGVHAIGVNLWVGSKRHVPTADAARMLDEVRAQGPVPKIVLVVVDPDPDALADAIATLCPDAVQLHGDAPPQRYVRALSGTAWIRVLRGEVDTVALSPAEPEPAWVLLDSAVAGYGGQGTPLSWAFAAAAVKSMSPRPVWLAGGLHPGNAAEAIARVRPAGLDVASGSEVPGDPRRKDPAAIAALAAICKEGAS